MDGKHFPMSDYAIGVTVPPFHPNCRGTTVPYYADLEGYGERFARNLDGDVIYVPADTTYEQWEKMQEEQYCDGSVDKMRKMHYNKSADLNQYKQYKKVLGFDAPKDFTAFRELKYNNKEAYKFYKIDYYRRNKLINHPEIALPNAGIASADDRKFTEYIFNPDNQIGFSKGKAFISRLGYDKDNYLNLKHEIIEKAKLYPATFKGSSQYGGRYEQKIIIYGKYNTPANVVIGWIVTPDSTKMTSAYIKEVD